MAPRILAWTKPQKPFDGASMGGSTTLDDQEKPTGPDIESDLSPPSTLDALAIIPSVTQVARATHRQNALQWYDWWVQKEWGALPDDLFAPLANTLDRSESQFDRPIGSLWNAIHQHMASSPESKSSVDDIVMKLDEDGIIQARQDREWFENARRLVIAVVGMQTMLFRINPYNGTPGCTAIVEEMDGVRGKVQSCLQPNSNCKRPIHELLLGFGMMLPPKNFNAGQNPEDRQAFHERTVAEPGSFNAYLLSKIGKLEFKWTDCLVHHLELNSSTNTLLIFRYPSFCLANLPSEQKPECLDSSIHACAAREAGQWATPADVSAMLSEVLLSYRLLFGQVKAARRLFRALQPFQGMAPDGRDILLERISGRKHCDIPGIVDRQVYDMPRDFPIFRSQLAILLRHLSDRNPRTWKDLWNDKRDSASWFTFWAVLIIGGLGILLATLQVVLQIIQISIS